MRHLLSLLLAIVLTPVVFLASGYANIKFAEAATGGKLVPMLLTVAAILVAGLAYSVLILARLSPVGTVLAGLALLGAVGWALVDLDSYLEVTPDKFLGVRDLLTAPIDGLTAVIAVPLVLTIASPRRWRRYANRPAAGPASAAPAYPTQPGAPTYSPSYSPAYTPPSSTPYSPYPADSRDIGDADTKVDELSPAETTSALPTEPTRPSSGGPSGSPYSTPPVPSQPSSPENWPRP
jgi:hypothetical protein